MEGTEMSRSQNGFAVVKNGSPRLVTITVGESPFRVRRFSRNAFTWLLAELDKIESVDEVGWDGGHAYRKIDGSSKWSPHASGTAIDWNASQHPRHGTQYQGWSKDQVKAIRELLATPQGKCFKWGADFQVIKDAMHFELIDKADYHRQAEKAGFE
jgi:hypothetical protein